MKEAVTVSQLNRYIKELINDDYILKNVYVRGEISNLRESKGNYYFVLKDESSSIQCIVFTMYSGIEVDVKELKDGSEVIVDGKVAVYERGGSYAIYVSKVTNVGLGDYFVKLEALKKKLLELGMFDKLYKKAIPKYSMNIGVVTAEKGAAIKDIYKTIKDRNPYANVILYPSLVQGDLAYQSIIDGIMTLDKMNLDVLIIGRGGGSIEDLYCYNDERLAYAIFNAKTPIISAVGHEINDSISDLVADMRVATPTAAGEAATFSYSEFQNDIENYTMKLNDVIDDKIVNLANRLENIKHKLDILAPKSKVKNYNEKITDCKKKIKYLINKKLSDTKLALSHYADILDTSSVLEKLSKGLLYTTDKNNKKISSVKQVKKDDIINARLVDGSIKSKVIAIEYSTLGV